MLQDTYIPVLPGLEAYHVGMRQCRCECGCDEVFFQPRIGRVRKYVNNAHKARAYRTKPATVKGGVKLSAQLGLMLDQAANPLWWPDDLTDAQEAFISEALHNPTSVLQFIALVRELEK